MESVEINEEGNSEIHQGGRQMKTCKDCKFFKQIITAKGWGRCTRHNTIVKENWPACNDFKECGKKEGEE